MIRVFSALVTVLGGLLLVAMCSAVQAQEPRQARITFTAPTQYVDGSAIDS